MQHRLKKRHLLVPGFASVFLVIAVIAVTASVKWIGRPFPGFLTGKALNVYPIAAPGWAFHAADLRAKDRLIAVNGTRIAAHTDMIRIVRGMTPGGKAQFRFERDGRIRDVRIRIVRFTLLDWLLTKGIFLLMAAVFLTVGLIVFYLKSRVDSSAIFALLSCSIGLFFLTYFDAYTDIRLVFFLDISMYLVPALMVHLALVFPDRLPSADQHRFIIPVIYLLPAFLWRLKAHYELSDYRVWAILDILSDALIFAAYLLFILILIRRSRQSANTLLRKRAQMTLMGLGMGFFIPSLTAVFSLHNGILTHNFSFFSAVLFPLYLGYAVIKHNFFNADRVVVNSVFYTVLLVILTVVFTGLASLTGVIFRDGISGRGVLITVFFTSVVISLSRMQHAAHILIARLLFRTPFSRTRRYLSGNRLLRAIHRLNERSIPVLKKLFATLGIEQAAVLFRGTGGLSSYCSFALPAEPSGIGRPTVSYLEKRAAPVTPLDIRETPLPEEVVRDLNGIFESTSVLIIMPIILEKNLLGMVLVGERPDGSAFRKQDIDILYALADHLAIARENTLLIERAREQERLEREMEIASEIQRHFLPESIVNRDWYELAVEYRPARVVGGDLYDIIQDDPDCLILCIGDVSGKGMPAALFGAVSQGILKAGADMGAGPGGVLKDINNRLLRIRPERLNLALAMARFDRKRGVLTLTNAGMPFPVLVRGSARFLEAGGIPLAIRKAERKYREIRVRFRPGDLFVFYSDGLTESAGRDGELFGEDRLIRILQESGGRSPGEILERVLGETDRYRNNRVAGDDTTLLALRIR